MPFKVTAHAYLLKITVKHNKNRILLLNLLINCISAKSAPQIIFIKDDHTFSFLNFLIIGLCNSSANFCFDINSLLTTPPGNLFVHVAEALALEDFLSRNFKPLEQIHVDVHHVLNF